MICKLASSGVFWALIASALYTVVAAFVKIAVLEFHVLQILFIRQVVVFLSTLKHTSKHPLQSLRTNQPFLHAIRLAGAFLTLSCGIWAVAVLPLTMAITLGFCQVFFVALLARLFLGEDVGRQQFSAIAVGFLGVVIIMRPGGEGILELNTLIPLLGALGGGIAVICTRRLSQTESATTLLLYQALFVGLLSGVPLFWFWIRPTPMGITLLLGIGILATLAQYCGIRALQLVEANVVGVFEYIKLVFAEILGVAFFDEQSDRQTLLGAAIIVLASAYTMYRRHIRLSNDRDMPRKFSN